jgi:hypothetical protein
MTITILSITRIISSIAFSVLDVTVDMFAGGDKKKAATLRDSFALAAAVADYGISVAAFGGIVAASAKASPLHKSDLRLSASADAFLVGFKTKVLSTDTTSAQGPLVALEEASITRLKPPSDVAPESPPDLAPDPNVSPQRPPMPDPTPPANRPAAAPAA